MCGLFFWANKSAFIALKLPILNRFRHTGTARPPRKRRSHHAVTSAAMKSVETSADHGGGSVAIRKPRIKLPAIRKSLAFLLLSLQGKSNVVVATHHELK